MEKIEVTAPRLINEEVRWQHRRRLPVRGALIHAIGQGVIVPGEDASIYVVDFLRRSPELIGSSVSTHRVVHPRGEISICVPDDRVAFHAGESQFGELRNLNQTFLGLELVVEGEWKYSDFVLALDSGEISYTEEQYFSAGWQCAQWMMEHKFGRDRIARHSSVASDDVRGPGLGKYDPGTGFSWRDLQEQITIHLEAAGHIG